MPILDLKVQTRIQQIGCIRIGDTVEKTTKDGRPYRQPVKIGTFRFTSPEKRIIEQIAELFGGTVDTYPGPKEALEYEVTTPIRELDVLIPPQVIDPNYEFYQGKAKSRFCDGINEHIRATPCLCRQWNNHQHTYYRGLCKLCGVSETWQGEPHNHDFANQGLCSVCGAGRLCKPTTRVSLMVVGVNTLGTWKLESHGNNAAVELPALAEVVRQSPMPLPGKLGIRFESRPRVVVKNGRETTEVREFAVPTLDLDWMKPEMLYSQSMEIARFARAAIDAPVFKGLELEKAPAAGSDPALPTKDDIIGWIQEAEDVDTLRELWQTAQDAKVMDQEVKDRVAKRRHEIEHGSEVVDAVIIE